MGSDRLLWSLKCRLRVVASPILPVDQTCRHVRFEFHSHIGRGVAVADTLDAMGIVPSGISIGQAAQAPGFRAGGVAKSGAVRH